MISWRLVGVALAVLVLGFSSRLFGQEEITVERSIPVPDSEKHYQPTKVDSSRIQMNWGKLLKGMTFDQVESLLGKPTKVASDIRDDSTDQPPRFVPARDLDFRLQALAG